LQNLAFIQMLHFRDFKIPGISELNKQQSEDNFIFAKK